MATVKTYLGAVKPVGSKIVFQYQPQNVKTADGSVDFDFGLVNNYLVTGLSLIKINASITEGTNQLLSATLLAVTSAGAETPIACAAFLNPTAAPAPTMTTGAFTGISGLGKRNEKAIAGVPSVTVAAGSPVANPTAGTVVTGIVSDTALIPFQQVPAGSNFPTLRLRITWNGINGQETMNAACLVEVDVAKVNLSSYFAGSTLQANGTGNGQGSEVLLYNA